MAWASSLGYATTNSIVSVYCDVHNGFCLFVSYFQSRRAYAVGHAWWVSVVYCHHTSCCEGMKKRDILKGDVSFICSSMLGEYYSFTTFVA